MPLSHRSKPPLIALVFLLGCAFPPLLLVLAVALVVYAVLRVRRAAQQERAAQAYLYANAPGIVQAHAITRADEIGRLL